MHSPMHSAYLLSVVNPVKMAALPPHFLAGVLWLCATAVLVVVSAAEGNSTVMRTGSFPLDTTSLAATAPLSTTASPTPSPSPSASRDGFASASASAASDEVNVLEFGAVADSGTDACMAFNRSIEAVRDRGAAVLRIPRGTYHFYWHTCGQWAPLMYVSNTVVTPLPPKSIGVWLRGLSNVVVEGEFSLLLMHGLMTPIAMDHSHNVTIRNLAVDFPHPSVVEAVVTSAASDGKSLEMTVHQGEFRLLPPAPLYYPIPRETIHTRGNVSS